ncbi:hypothetical protein CK203_043408 [Vitis vinifera]|uniref:Uncharacterized protein n=1 Tax=Vitis vinifera TaxID=29760 RepID=A0A438IAG7_VITVI|nr:hypothetical protein CK203_043408 [Vitis vinifera]
MANSSAEGAGVNWLLPVNCILVCAEMPHQLSNDVKFIILHGSTRILQSWLASQGRGKYWRLETVAGVITGFSTSLISISLVRILHQVKSWLPRILKRQLLLAVKSVRFRRAFFLVTYVIFMGWLAIEYGKRLGISNIYRVYYF